MKKFRGLALIISILAGGGTAIYNYTGKDVVLESGEVIEAVEMPKHLTKAFGERDKTKIKYITIHHTAGSDTQALEDIAEEQIKRGFAEFAYHLAIYKDGSVFAANDLEEVTWGDSGQNINSIHIVLVGNYELYKPTAEQIFKLKELNDGICQVYDIQSIRAHRDTSPTLCCGTLAYETLTENGIFFNNK